VSTLIAKLDKIRNGAYEPFDFIIADAKDGDMAMGIVAPGPKRDASGKPKDTSKSLQEYLAAMEEMTKSGLVDIMLMSASNAETLSNRGLFADDKVTPAVRHNDTTDIWSMRGSSYNKEPSQNFRSANLERVRAFSNLGLYSITFSNDLDCDLETLEAYGAYRDEVVDLGLDHFLEVFNPAFDIGISGEELGDYINDSILKTLAGLVSAERPQFLKMQYNGPKAMEQLAAYNPTGLIVGILGGAKGTTRDTFELISQAEKYGARVALFGRKINLAEDPIALVGLMRQVVERTVMPLDAVNAYHDQLAKSGRVADRDIEADREITDAILKVSRDA
jgi:hypothetical protein